MQIRSIVSSVIVASCLLGTAPNTVAAPQETGIVTTEDDPRSRKIEKLLDGYLKGDFAEADVVFKPDTRFYWADNGNPMTLDQWREGVTLQHEAFRDFKMMNRNIVTTVYPDHGTLTSVWTNWQATSKATGQPLDLPLQLTYRWDGDRVSDEYAYFDKGRFESVLVDTLARLKDSETPCPWKWVLGAWRVTGGPAPDAVVNWAEFEGSKDTVRGEWITTDGVRLMQFASWDPSTGSITSDTYGTDGSTMRMVISDFPGPTKMSGTYRSRSGDGRVSGGHLEIEKESKDRMVGRFTDEDGTKVERIYTPATEDDPLRKTVAPMLSGSDWRTRKVDEMHANYMKGDIDAMKPLFSKDSVHVWGDPDLKAGRAEWAEGLAMHHKVFKDITLKNLYTISGEYSDGNIWSTSWFEWNGTDRKTGEKVVFLVHCAFRWDGDKIVEEEVYFDVGRFKKYAEAADLN